jgi:hypothetical protein
MRMRIGRLAAAALISLVLAGCVAWVAGEWHSNGPSQIGLGVVNATDLRLNLLVNGTVIETIAPQGADTRIYTSSLPSLPWAVEARTTSGRILGALTVTAADLQTEPGISSHGAESGVDLSCGQLYMWSGPQEPSWPAPGLGSPGDCVP